MVEIGVGPITVILLRTLVPFTILRWPLLGTILAILSDTSDLIIFEGLGFGFLSGIEYQRIDKVFDMWQLAFELIIVLSWKDILAKKTGTILFGWRAAGFLVFILFGIREVFVFAPNIFEYFFLLMLVIWKVDKKFKLNWKKLAIILLIVGVPTIIKEYIMHYKYPGKIWFWSRQNLLPWLYD